MSNKKIAKNSIYLYIRLVVTMFVGIYTSRYVLSALGVSDYGLYNVVGGIVGLMTYVNTIMITSTYRFLAYEQGKPGGNVNKVFNISFSLHLAAAILILTLAATIGKYYIGHFLVLEEGKLADAYFVFIFSVINILGQVIGTPFIGLLVANEKFSITVPIEIGTKVLVLMVAVLLNYVPSNHLRIYAVLITIVHWANPISYVLYSVKHYHNTVKWKFQREMSQYKAMFSFTGWNMLEVGAVMGEGQGSAIIINRFFGTILNASFGIAKQMNNIVLMFAKSLGQAVVPQITKSYSSGDHKRASQLTIMASKYSFFLMAIPMLPILLEADFIIHLWLKQVPEFTSVFVKAMLIRSIISSSQFGIGPLIHASGNIKLFKIVTSGIMIMSLPLSYLAFSVGYPAYTISYIYIACALLGFISNQILLKVILNYNSLEFLTQSTLKILMICLAQIPVFIMIRLFSPGFVRFIVFSVISEILLFTSIYVVGINSNERERIRNFIKGGMIKLKGFRQNE